MEYVKHMNRKRIMSMILAGTLVLSATACGKSTNASKNATSSATESSVKSGNIVAANTTYTAASIDASKMFTTRDTEIGYDMTTATSVKEITGGTYKITEEGTYVFSGELKGQILVEASKDAKVQIVLSDASITNESSAAIYVKSADKVFLTIEGDNSVTTTSDFVAIDDNNIDGAIFSKETLTMNGDGKLTVTSKSGNGIVSKDTLKITSGTISITAGLDGIQGKDSVRISGGDIKIEAGNDGIQSNNDEDEEKGFIYISGGNIDVKAGTNSNSEESSKGIKAYRDIVIDGGTIKIDSTDDSIHADNSITINDGAIEVASKDDGIHAEAVLYITDGTVNVTKSYEGLEGEIVHIAGGKIDITASDDGINAAGSSNNNGDAWGGDMKGDKGNFMPNFQDGEMPQMQDNNFQRGGRGNRMDVQTEDGQDGSNAQKGRMGGGMMMDTDENAVIRIDGGDVTVNASGDGIDSNGYVYINGGNTVVYGPTNDGNAALDFGLGVIATGGKCIALGSSGMAEAFSTESTQGAMLVNIDTTASKGSVVELKDSTGKVIMSVTGIKTFDSIAITSPDIKKGETYTLSVDGNDVTVEMTDVTYSNSKGGFGGTGGQGGMRNFNKDEL
ncbi:MAG TPA: hypothetical protein DEO82_06280 [Eubacterium sp.]|nr:hypothetical protein [Eubacterium sp.]